MLMILVRLVYASHFKQNDYTTTELARILEKATANNGASDLSGALLFGDDYFLQCLEGGREAVNKLFLKICQDPRHENVLLLRYEEVSERKFEDWSMKLVMLTEKNNSLIKRFSTSGKFNPLRMSSQSALDLMVAIRDH